MNTHLMVAVTFTLGRWTVTGSENCPRTGPVIVASNHISAVDPPFLSACLPRRVHFMAKKELFARGFTAFHVRTYGAFPVNRFEADLAALRQALGLLEAGRAIAVFPEGTRSHDRSLQKPYPGVALLALRSGAPVLPVGLTGTDAIRDVRSIVTRPRLTAAIGEPLHFERRRRVRTPDIDAASDRIMHAIAALLPPSHRGVYGGG